MCAPQQSIACAVTLFCQRSSTEDGVLAREIVELLRRLPLAVDQAAAYVAQTGTR